MTPSACRVPKGFFSSAPAWSMGVGKYRRDDYKRDSVLGIVGHSLNLYAFSRTTDERTDGRTGRMVGRTRPRNEEAPSRASAILRGTGKSKHSGRSVRLHSRYIRRNGRRVQKDFVPENASTDLNFYNLSLCIDGIQYFPD